MCSGMPTPVDRVSAPRRERPRGGARLKACCPEAPWWSRTARRRGCGRCSARRRRRRRSCGSWRRRDAGRHPPASEQAAAGGHEPGTRCPSPSPRRARRRAPARTSRSRRAREAGDRIGERAGDSGRSRPEEGGEKLESSSRFPPLRLEHETSQTRTCCRDSPERRSDADRAPASTFLLSPTTAHVRVVRRPSWALRSSLRCC